MRIVAVGAALVALVFTGVAVVVVLTRGESSSAASESPAAMQVADRDVQAADVVRLRRDVVELVMENGTAKGVKIRDAVLARSLGLEPDDVITAISGIAMTRELAAYDAVFKLGLMNPTTVYVEVARNKRPLLVRWKLDSDVSKARTAATAGSASWSSALGTLGGGGTGIGGLGTYTPPSPDPDPLLDSIEKIDETHYRLPRATADALLADPARFARSARVVPSMVLGQPDGFKLYAIRPSSTIAHLGLTNGDTIHAINGIELTAPDKALEAFTKLKTANEVTIDLTRRGHLLSLTLQITK